MAGNRLHARHSSGDNLAIRNILSHCEGPLRTDPLGVALELDMSGHPFAAVPCVFWNRRVGVSLANLVTNIGSAGPTAQEGLSQSG